MRNITGKVPFKDFYRKSIEILKQHNKIDPTTGKPYNGVHVVYSGFNEAFKKYYGFDPRTTTDQLAAEGKISVWKFSKGGPIIYLPEDVMPHEIDDIIEEGRSKKSSVDNDTPFYNLTPNQQDIYKRMGAKGDPDNDRSFDPANRHKKHAKASPKRIKKSSKPSKSHSKKICSCKKK